MSNQTRLKGTKCLHCDKLLDAATGVNNDTPMPIAGSVSICFYCGNIAIFAADLTLRPPTAEEQIEIAGHPTILAVQKARKKIQS